MAKGKRGSGDVSKRGEWKNFMKNAYFQQYRGLFFGVIIVAVAAMVYQITRGVTKPAVEVITDNPADLERVFRSGQPWVVHCKDSEKAFLPPVLSRASDSLLQKGVSIGILDCDHTKLPSGKTVMERFDINRSLKPTVFGVANGLKPHQFAMYYLNTPKKLVDEVLKVTTKHLYKITSQTQFESKCLKKSQCVLLLRGSKFDKQDRATVQQLMDSYRTVTFAELDAAQWETSLESKIPAFERGNHRVIFFAKQEGKSADDKQQRGKVQVKAHRDTFTYDDIASFIEEARGSELPLVSMPTIRKRPPPAQPKRQRTKQSRKSENRLEGEEGVPKGTGGDPAKERDIRDSMEGAAQDYYAQAADGEEEQTEPEIVEEEFDEDELIELE